MTDKPRLEPDLAVERPPVLSLARWNDRARALWGGGARKQIEATVEGAPGPTPATGRPGAGFSGYRATLFLFVVLPALATVLYMVFLAGDQFSSETRFALRTAPGETREAGGGAGQSQGALASMGLPSAANQDAYIVASYVRSPAVFADLAPTVDVRAMFRRPEADFWARLPADASLETLTAYWRGMVATSVDSLSGIVTVTVRAFRPDDALALARAITGASEKLVNEMSARARADVMARAEAEVQRAEKQVQAALAALRAFRDSEGMISPAATADRTSTLLMTTMSDRIRMQAEFDVALRTMSPNAPTLPALRARLAAADQEIEKLKAQLTGPGARVVSGSIARFEELELQRQFSEKLYLMAQESLERARQKAERQTVYLSAFAPPFLPQEARYPRRLEYSLLIPLGLLIVWGIFAMLAATIEDHRV
jgi:capsular polysaccharide transport system permease protein